VYRIFLSPLRGMPGPWGMRISKLVHVWIVTDTKTQNCKLLDEFRRRYGNIVHTGK
jgi:hypothetical protein